MRRIWGASALLVASLCAPGVQAQGGDWEVNNGGSAVTRTLHLAYYRIERLGSACLDGNPCRLSDRERGLLLAIVKAMPREYEVQPKILVESESAKPGFFRIEGEVKAAKTGSAVGSPIYFNRDLLNVRGPGGQVNPISFGEAVAQILHELGHHHGAYAHDELDVLGAKVALGTSGLLLTSPVLPDSRAVNLQVLNSLNAKAFPDVFLRVHDDVWDISMPVRQEINCPLFELPIPIRGVPDISLRRRPALGAKYHNLHWETFREARDGKSSSFEIQMNVSAYCAAKQGSFVWEREAKVRVKFDVRRKPNGRLRLDPATFELKGFRDHWWKIFNFGF